CWVTYPTSSFIPRREEFGVKDLRQCLQGFDDARPRTVEILIAIRDKDALPLHCLQLAPAGAALNQWHLYGIAQDCLACDPSLSHIHSLIRIPNCCTSQWTDLASQKKIKPRRGNGSNERPTGRSRQETRSVLFSCLRSLLDKERHRRLCPWEAAQPDLLAAKEFIDCVGFAVAPPMHTRRTRRHHREQPTDRGSSGRRACLRNYRDRDRAARSAHPIDCERTHAWSRRRHLQSALSARSPTPCNWRSEPPVRSIPRHGPLG